MDTELLKRKILQLAMQGKLVKQDENDGSAEELIDKILEEKKKMMAEGKIKKEKISRIYKNPADNHYYEKFDDCKEKLVKPPLLLPDGWQFIKMNDIVFYEQPSKYIVESTEYDDNYEIPVLTPGKSFILGHTNETSGIFTNVPAIIFDDFTTESKYVDFNFKVKSSAIKILNCSKLVNIKFIYFLLQIINVDITTHKRHWLSNYEYMIVPIPSKIMQDKIVKKIEDLFNKVNEIDIHYNKIRKLRTTLKSKIIDLAIRGDLTKQLSTDEPSSKLIEKILDEKHKLMKEGKIKKENLSFIYKDADNQFYEKFDDGSLINVTEEIPFEIPDNWIWTKYKNICTISSARRVHKSDWKTNGIPFYRAREIAKLSEQDFVDNELFISEKLYEKFSESGVPQKDDIMITAVGTLGKCYIVKESDKFYYKDASVICLENRFNLNSNYIVNYMNSNVMKKQIKSNSSGTTVDTLTLVRMNEYYIPIPPLEEQKRIVSIIQQLLIILQ